MEFKVKKSVSKEPLLWGMRMPQFVIFLGVTLLNAFSLLGGLTLKKFLIASLVVGGTFLLMRILSTNNVIRLLFSDRFPNYLKIDR